MPMKIVVTGGAGFIGSNFIRYMRSAHPEHKILCLDKLTYAGSLDNLTGILGSPDFIFSKTDIADEKAVNEVLKSFMPDVIVNFAAESHVDRSIADARDFVRTNVEGVRVLLEAARMTGARFHQISTDEVYGDLPVRSTEKFTETSALRPSSPYSATKAAADLLALSYHRTYGLFVTVSSNNYGMHQYPEKLIPLAVKNILGGKPVPVYGDGGNVRDWIAVEDHSEAVDIIRAHKSRDRGRDNRDIGQRQSGIRPRQGGARQALRFGYGEDVRGIRLEAEGPVRGRIRKDGERLCGERIGRCPRNSRGKWLTNANGRLSPPWTARGSLTASRSR